MKAKFVAVVRVTSRSPLLATNPHARRSSTARLSAPSPIQPTAVPGATVTITHMETNQSRETTTNETGGYNFPNVAAGTYRVEVTLPGFQTFRAQEIAVRLNAAVRVDARLAVGTLQESVLVSADAVLLQTETAAVQTQTTSQQLQNLPINGRSFQSALTLTPGVAQPNYFQTGGINNPARSMQVTVNGAPNSNTVFRLDGVSATNQWIQGLQAYTPAIEAIETVNVVTNSFDAEQGMAGGASVNVQIKSGTNTLHGSAFEYLTHDKLRSRNYFLPADREKTKDNKSVFGGTVGGPIKRDRLFYFLSVESTVQRTIGGPYVTQASARRRSSSPSRPRRSGPATSRELARSFTIPKPEHPRNRARAVCLCQLRADLDRGSTVRRRVISSGGPHQPGVEKHPGPPAAAAAAGNANNYFAIPNSTPTSTRSTRRSPGMRAAAST